MDHSFWHQIWQANQIGFHQPDINPWLQGYWSGVAGPDTGKVLVPLCGKSRDLWWLHERGHPVVGVELSPIACTDFFAEAGQTPEIRADTRFTRYVLDRLELWCGDFFALKAEDVQDVHRVYDRAALIALPPDMRRRYADLLCAILPADTRMLLITLDHDADVSGPPFAVPEEEVRSLYGPYFDVDTLRTTTLPEDHPLVQRGMQGAREEVFVLTRQK
ncbi:MAG: thiopurine S-methyltransferase [Gammaproteobacteria bacterium]|nr:MAG: thiopurine S-methyltransferase [Gammaproteobacteria bacterium]